MRKIVCLMLLVVGVVLLTSNKPVDNTNKWKADRDSLPVYIQMAEQGDARAQYILAAAIFQRWANNDTTLTMVEHYTLADGRELCKKAAEQGYLPAMESWLNILNNDVEIWKKRVEIVRNGGKVYRKK